MSDRIANNSKKKDSDPLVSILCITYNHENYIKECLEGILMQQTTFPFEILIHDDASTDIHPYNHPEYAAKHPQPHKTLFPVRANQHSQGNNILYTCFQVFPKIGKYIAICEGDDYWTDSNKLQKQVDFLENNSEYVITYGSIQAFNEAGFLKDTFQGATGDLAAMQLKRAVPINTPTVCFRNVIRVFPPELNCSPIGDLFLWSLLGFYGKGKYLPEINPTSYRVHPGGVYSMKSSIDKLGMRVVTSGALFSYYYRIEDRALTAHFQKQHLVAAIKFYGFLPLFRLIFKGLMKRIYNSLFKKVSD